MLYVFLETAGVETDIESLKAVKEIFPQVVVLSNTGVKLQNVEDQLGAVDGAVVGSTFKYDGVFENHVDKKRVKEFMDKVKTLR